MDNETRDKYKEAEKALLDFVIRVSKGKTASEKEVEALPEVVNILFSFKRTF